MPIFMRYGSNKGNVGSAGKGHVDGMSLGSKTITPGTVLQVLRDATLHGGQSGLGSYAAGKRLQQPFRILKEVDRSSPAIFQAAVAGMTGNRLAPKLHINFYKTNAQGKSQPYFTIILRRRP